MSEEATIDFTPTPITELCTFCDTTYEVQNPHECMEMYRTRLNAQQHEFRKLTILRSEYDKLPDHDKYDEDREVIMNNILDQIETLNQGIGSDTAAQHFARRLRLADDLGQAIIDRSIYGMQHNARVREAFIAYGRDVQYWDRLRNAKKPSDRQQKLDRIFRNFQKDGSVDDSVLVSQP